MTYKNANPKPATVRLKGKAKSEFREEVCRRAFSRCQTCGAFAPLKHDFHFDVFYCGHVSHIRSVGAGGSDTMDNVIWQCFKCHDAKHRGLKE